MHFKAIKTNVILFAIAVIMMQSRPLHAAYVGFGIFTIGGNNSSANPVIVNNIPNSDKLRVTYISGYFFNCGPVPGWGAYGIDPVKIVRSNGSISSFLANCSGPLGGYYSTSDAAVSCALSQPPLVLKTPGNSIQMYATADPGAACDTETKRSGSMTVLIEVDITNNAPLIVIPPSSQASPLGSNVTFNVIAGSQQPLNYQWQFNGQNISGATSDTLALNSVTAASSGGYSVIISNPYGFVTSSQATLKILTVDTTVPCYLITATPLPDREVGKNKLVLVTHGWEWTVLNQGGPPAQTWLDQFTNGITMWLAQHDVEDWQVEKYEWLSSAWTYYPNDALNNAQIIGTQIGNQIADQGWQQVHLIAHSAGAGLIQAATDAIHKKSPGTIVQETFLDPYTGPWLAGRSEYGQNAYWADDYFVFDLGTDLAGPGLTVLGQLQAPDSTSGQLNWAYNVDVGSTLQVDQLPFYIGSGVAGPIAGYYVAAIVSPSHGSPIDFYYNTITGTGPTCAADYGFALSMEAGGAFYWPGLPVDNSPLPLCGISSFSQTPQPINLNSSFNLATQQNSTSDLGASLINNSAILTADSTSQTELKSGGIRPAGNPSNTSTAWLATAVTVSNVVNFVQFDASYSDSNNAEGLLTVLWDTNKIGAVDERVVGQNLNTYRFFLPNTVSNGVYVLGYRLDAFDNTTSTIVITNVATGYYGVTTPIDLSISITNGTPLLQIRAAENFAYLIENSTNLMDWTPMALLLNTNGTCQLLDSAGTNSSVRFYRALLQ